MNERKNSWTLVVVVGKTTTSVQQFVSKFYDFIQFILCKYCELMVPHRVNTPAVYFTLL
jgi:hypothetical protein